MTQLDLEKIRQRLQFGGMPPLTLAEQKELFAIATGQTAEQKKRCPLCEADGRVSVSTLRSLHGYGVDPDSDGVVECPCCRGAGYVD